MANCHVQATWSPTVNIDREPVSDKDNGLGTLVPSIHERHRLPEELLVHHLKLGPSSFWHEGRSWDMPLLQGSHEAVQERVLHQTKQPACWGDTHTTVVARYYAAVSLSKLGHDTRRRPVCQLFLRTETRLSLFRHSSLDPRPRLPANERPD